MSNIFIDWFANPDSQAWKTHKDISKINFNSHQYSFFDILYKLRPVIHKISNLFIGLLLGLSLISFAAAFFVSNVNICCMCSLFVIGIGLSIPIYVKYRLCKIEGKKSGYYKIIDIMGHNGDIPAKNQECLTYLQNYKIKMAIKTGKNL